MLLLLLLLLGVLLLISSAYARPSSSPTTATQRASPSDAGQRPGVQSSPQLLDASPLLLAAHLRACSFVRVQCWGHASVYSSRPAMMGSIEPPVVRLCPKKSAISSKRLASSGCYPTSARMKARGQCAKNVRGSSTPPSIGLQTLRTGRGRHRGAKTPPLVAGTTKVSGNRPQMPMGTTEDGPGSTPIGPPPRVHGDAKEGQRGEARFFKQPPPPRWARQRALVVPQPLAPKLQQALL